MVENMMMSAFVPVELNKKRIALGMSWRGLIERGLESIETTKASNALVEEYRAIKAKQERTAKLLQQYIDESNQENEVC